MYTKHPILLGNGLSLVCPLRKLNGPFAMRMILLYECIYVCNTSYLQLVWHHWVCRQLLPLCFVAMDHISHMRQLQRHHTRVQNHTGSHRWCCHQTCNCSCVENVLERECDLSSHHGDSDILHIQRLYMTKHFDTYVHTHTQHTYLFSCANFWGKIWSFLNHWLHYCYKMFSAAFKINVNMSNSLQQVRKIHTHTREERITYLALFAQA